MAVSTSRCTTSSTTTSNNTNQYNAKVNSSSPYSQTNITPIKDSQGRTVAINSSQSFLPNTMYAQAYDAGNRDFNQFYNEWKNPSLDSVTNQARIQAYDKEMNKGLQNDYYNNILNPLANSNMLRSSQATNMYNNLINQAADKRNDFTTNLLAESEANAQNRLQALYNAYAQGQAAMNGDLNSAIQMANGNSTSKGTSTSTSG